MLARLLRTMLRRKTPIEFPNFSQLHPTSRIFGLDRGLPIDRYYIENFLNRKSPFIQGRILEVADNCYSKRFSRGKNNVLDILQPQPGDGATIIGDLTDQSTLPDNAIDCFICTQTFNFIFDVQAAVEGAHHLLKAGGTLLATMAGISQVSRYDMERWGDFWRFTTASVQKLFEPVFKGCLEIESFGNALAATAFLQGLAVEDLPDVSLLEHQDPDYQLLITVFAKKAL